MRADDSARRSGRGLLFGVAARRLPRCVRPWRMKSRYVLPNPKSAFGSTCVEWIGAPLRLSFTATSPGRSRDGVAIMSHSTALVIQSSRVVGITLARSVGSTEVGEIWRILTKGLFNPYRPELHYIRGPGP